MAPGARPLALLLPALVVVVTSLVLGDFCRQLLAEASQAHRITVDRLPLALVLVGFVLASAALVVVQAGRLRLRVSGPERRLVQALRRMREGDLSFRVHLRRGDPLVGVARECNELLDWLNANPPSGVRTGGDIVEVDPFAHADAGEALDASDLVDLGRSSAGLVPAGAGGAEDTLPERERP